MNTDHINYQQQISQSVQETKEHESTEKISETPKGQLSTSSSTTGLSSYPVANNGPYQSIQTNLNDPTAMLTPDERRERIFTLLIIASIALLTGKLVE